MGMLKSELSFDQLMAQATLVAKQQDAALLERARQKRREDEERRRREERAMREKREAQELLAKKREMQEKKQRQLVEQKKQQKRQEKLVKPRPSRPDPRTILPEKKKPVQMSFEDLMKKAKEQSLAKKEYSTTKKPSITINTNTTAAKATTKPSTTTNHGPSLYHRAKKPELKNDTGNNSHQSTLSVRERAKLMVSEPPKKVIGQKRDKRSIAEVQRDIRHAKGIYSDDEDERRKNDPRLMINKNKSTQRYQPSDAAIGRKRPLSPTRPAKKLDVPRRPVTSAPIPRMPFTGRPLDRNAAKLPVARRYRNDDDDEEDDDLASFIVDDEEEDPYYRRKNSYSDEISKIFRYDRSRFANEPVFSDDDMEANASEVLREEKRSERIARREDLIEEQKELERLKRRKKSSA